MAFWFFQALSRVHLSNPESSLFSSTTLNSTGCLSVSFLFATSLSLSNLACCLSGYKLKSIYFLSSSWRFIDCSLGFKFNCVLIRLILATFCCKLSISSLFESGSVLHLRYAIQLHLLLYHHIVFSGTQYSLEVFHSQK